MPGGVPAAVTAVAPIQSPQTTVPATAGGTPASPTGQTAAPTPVAGIRQDPIELAYFKNNVLARVNEADSDAYSDEEKSIVREQVSNLTALQLIDTIYFTSGSIVDNAAEVIPKLETALKDNSVKEMLSVKRGEAGFIILGFADPTGTVQQNLKVSKGRADYIKGIVKKNHPGVRNIIARGIGKTTLLAKEEQKKNRAVEVWLAVSNQDISNVQR